MISIIAASRLADILFHGQNCRTPRLASKYNSVMENHQIAGQ